MTEFENFTSSPIARDSYSSDCESIVQNNPLFLKNKCINYHEKLDTVHGKIYRYYTFLELLHYLQSTLLAHLPFIDYPTDEILMMILTATQLNHVEDKSSDELINLSIPSINYLNSLISVFETQNIDLADEDISIFEEELENLYKKLNTLFSFLKPNLPKRGRRKRGDPNMSTILNIDDSMLDYSMDEKSGMIDDNLRKEKLQSVFEISTTSDKFNTSTTSANSFFGLSYLSETEKRLWNYFIFAFKTASKLTNIERIDSYESYLETWNRWREFLNTIIRFMNLQLYLSNNNEEVLSSLFHLNLISISSFTDPFNVDNSSYTDALVTLAEYTFINLESAVEIPGIISTDLSLGQKYIFSENPFLIEKQYEGSGICSDSIATRVRLLSLIWNYVRRLSIATSVTSPFIKKVCSLVLKLDSQEFYLFYSTATTNKYSSFEDNILFVLSFEILHYLSRSFTVDSSSFFEDIPQYLQQVKEIFEKYSSNNDKTNITFEKLFVLVRFQLHEFLKVSNLNNEELNLLSEIKYQRDGTEYNLRTTIKPLVT